MAVYTEIGVDDLGAMLAAYDVGTPRTFKGIAEGVENSNYLLQTDQARFILTLYEKRVSADDLPFFLSLLEHLAKKGIACPQPLRTRADDHDAVLQLGVAWSTLQCAELLAGGAPGVHFYTLNRSPATRAILSALRAARPWERVR